MFPPKETWTEYMNRLKDQIVDLEPKPLTPYVDEYGRPTTGPGAGTTAGPMAAGEPEKSFGAEIIQAIRDAFTLENIQKALAPPSNVTTNPDWLADFKLSIDSLISPLNQLIQNMLGNNGIENFGEPAGAPSEIPPIQTSLKIDLQSQSQLIVDGRVLADIIKPYLYNDMVSFEQSAGTIGSAYVAA
jgi:hypothetical protein